MKLRSLVLSLAVAGSSSLAIVACGGTVEHTQTSASAVTKAPIGVQTHGFVKIVGDALGEVALRPEQRTEIEKLAADAETRHAPTLQGRKELMLAFADQIEQGAVDKGALQAKLDRVVADLEKTRSDDRAAIVKLHDLLDAEQRNAFVDALESQMKARRGAHGHEQQGAGGELGHGPGGFMHMKKLAEDLKLTDDQRSKAHEVMRDSFKEAMKERHGERAGHGRHGMAHGKHALEAFREDKLDLDKVAPPHDLKAAASAGSDRAAAMAQKLLPILTAEQRKIAADKVRAMASSGDSSLLVH